MPRLARADRRRLLGAVSAAMLLLAVLPSVVPFDHLLPGAANGAPAAEAAHSQHCHGAPGSCADAPVAAGPGQFILADPLIIAPPILALAVALATVPMRGIAPRPRTRPPRARATVAA